MERSETFLCAPSTSSDAIRGMKLVRRRSDNVDRDDQLDSAILLAAGCRIVASLRVVLPKPA